MMGLGQIFAGYSQAQTYNDQAALAERQAKDVNLQSVQVSEQRREQLRSSLATIAANRAQGGLNLDSPTAQAIEGAVKSGANRTEQIQRVGFQNQRQSLLWGAEDARRSASNAITAGWIGGATSAMGSAASAMGF